MDKWEQSLQTEKELKEIRATLGCKPGDELKMLQALIEENKSLEEKNKRMITETKNE